MEEKLYKISDLGSPLFTSRSSEVYYWEDYNREEEVLLKLFRSGVDQKMIDSEEINTKETYAKGVSAVACYGQVRVEEKDGTVRSGILLKKNPGTDSDRQGYETSGNPVCCTEDYGRETAGPPSDPYQRNPQL